MEQAKFAEAEPPLVAGYRGMAQRKAVLPAALRRAGEWILQLYTNWGNPEQAAEWRREIEAAGSSAPGAKN